MGFEAPPSNSNLSISAGSSKLKTRLDNCLENPERVLFLDIETTGLSHHYDDITLIGWAMEGRGHAVIRGSDIGAFYDAMSMATGLVTFNGIRFDTKFIKRDYPDIEIPDSHIDLMYLCRRVGLKGGQKRIEEQLNIKVRNDEESIDGAQAVVLWHQYTRGNEDALFRLIAYKSCRHCGDGSNFE